MSSKGASFLFIGLLFATLSFFIFNSGDDMDYYRITVGDKELSYYVMEDTTRNYIEDVISSSIHNDGYVTRSLLEVPITNLKVKVEAFNCVDKESGNILNCKTFYETEKTPHLKPLENTNFSYKIISKDKVIYEGKYVEDLTGIIKEKGQYYFIATLSNSEKKKIKETKILFSLKVR